MFPAGAGVPLHFEKENVMFAIHATRETRPVGVLLGGSGRALLSAVHRPLVAALLRPHPTVFTRVGVLAELRAA
jgi:hypothetical protein